MCTKIQKYKNVWQKYLSIFLHNIDKKNALGYLKTTFTFSFFSKKKLIHIKFFIFQKPLFYGRVNVKQSNDPYLLEVVAQGN